MVDVIDAQMDKLTKGLDRAAKTIVGGNTLSDVVERQVIVSEQQVMALEKR